MNDKALREALRQQSDQTPRHLPSNFAFNTLRRIERERRVRERRETVIAAITITACCLLGFGTIIYFYGHALLDSLAAMTRQSEAFSILPGMAFCCMFFAALNYFLRRRFV